MNGGNEGGRMARFKILHMIGKDRYDGIFEYLVIDPDPEVPVGDYLAPGDEIEEHEIVEIEASWKNIPSGYQFNRTDV